MNERKVIDRRKIERRAPKPGVNVRYSDKDNGSLDVPKRVRLGKLKKP